MAIDKNVTIDKDYDIAIARGNIIGVSSLSKFGENTEIPNSEVFQYICDNGGIYIPPAEIGGEIHNVDSSSANDAGVLKASGTVTDIGNNGGVFSFTDENADFNAANVQPGDAILNDSKIVFAQVTSVSENSIELGFAGGVRSPHFGRLTNGFSKGDVYRIVSVVSTGSTILYIDGIDGRDYLRKEEFVILNGTTSVPTTNPFRRINRMKTFGGVGTNNKGNDGVVNATSSITNEITSQIRINENQTFQAIFSLSADRTGYITKWWSSLTSKNSASSKVRFRGGDIGGVGYPIQSRGMSNDKDIDHSFKDDPQPVAGGSDVWVEANSNAINTSIAAGFSIRIYKS